MPEVRAGRGGNAVRQFGKLADEFDRASPPARRHTPGRPDNQLAGRDFAAGSWHIVSSRTPTTAAAAPGARIALREKLPFPVHPKIILTRDGVVLSFVPSFHSVQPCELLR